LGSVQSVKLGSNVLSAINIKGVFSSHDVVVQNCHVKSILLSCCSNSIIVVLLGNGALLINKGLNGSVKVGLLG